MRFTIIDPREQSTEMIDSSFDSAVTRARLPLNEVDYGTISLPSVKSGAAGIAVIVFGLGLFVPPETQSYFAIKKRLYAGSAVLYGFNTSGDTVDVPPLNAVSILWLPDRDAVEDAIIKSLVTRPVIGCADDIIWRWPGPRPSPAEHDAMMERVAKRSDVIIVDNDTIIMKT